MTLISLPVLYSPSMEDERDGPLRKRTVLPRIYAVVVSGSSTVVSLPGFCCRDVLAVYIAVLTVYTASRPVPGAAGDGKLLAAVIAVYNTVAGGGAGAETNAVAAYVSRRLDNGVRLRSGFGSGFRRRFRSRLRSDLRDRLRSCLRLRLRCGSRGGRLAVGESDVLAEQHTALTVVDAGRQSPE